MCLSPFFFNDTATTEIYTLSLHDALPISYAASRRVLSGRTPAGRSPGHRHAAPTGRPSSGNAGRSEEHTSELQSQSNLVCRLLLEKKKTNQHSNRRQLTPQSAAHSHVRPL